MDSEFYDGKPIKALRREDYLEQGQALAEQAHHLADFLIRGKTVNLSWGDYAQMSQSVGVAVEEDTPFETLKTRLEIKLRTMLDGVRSCMLSAGIVRSEFAPPPTGDHPLWTQSDRDEFYAPQHILTDQHSELLRKV